MSGEKKPKAKDTLIDFDSIEKNLEHVHQINRGIHPISISKIVGSIGRYQDFTEGFLPQKGRVSAQYESVKRALVSGKILPPIKVYKILDNYFVIDGHHRVTVSKNELNGIEIDAEIIEIDFDFELSRDKKYHYITEQARKFLIRLQEDSFERETDLKNRILKYPVKVTDLTAYVKLFEEIAAFKSNYNSGEFLHREICIASYTWYEKKFLPIVQIIIDENVLEKFPKRTYTDLYVWLQEHKYYLSQRAGYDVGFDFTKEDFVQKYRKIKFFDLLPQLVADIAKTVKKEIKRIDKFTRP